MRGSRAGVKLKTWGLRFGDLFGHALFPEEVKQRRLTELVEA